jgi:hypothetical protein
LCHFHLHLQCILIRFTPSISLPCPPLLLLTISAGFMVLFSCKYTKYIDQIHPPSPSLFTLALPLVHPPPSNTPVLYSWPSFLKCILIAQRSFCPHISHMNILYFNHSNLLFDSLFLSPAPPTPDSRGVASV